VNLGLNRVQVRIYLTLVSLGAANAKKIAQTANVDQSEVYQVLEELHGRSLVQKIIKVPTEYQPLTLSEAIKILIEQRDRETKDIKQRAEKILNKVAPPPKTETDQEFFTLIPQNDFRTRYVARANISVEKEWVVYTQIERFPITSTAYYETNKKAYDRGVHFRFLLELNRPTDEILKFIQKESKENPLNEIRYTDNILLTSFAIYDKKEMNFSVKYFAGLANSDMLVTNNTQLVKIAQDYFELRWKNAMREYPKR